MPNFEDFSLFDGNYLRRSHFNEAAITALQRGQGEAGRLGATALDARLALVGLMSDDTNLAAKMVRQLGQTPERIGYAARTLFHEPPFDTDAQATPHADLPIPEELRQLCRLAVDEAMRMGARTVGPEHLLLAMTRDDDHSAGQLLKQAGVTLERARHVLRIVLGEPS